MVFSSGRSLQLGEEEHPMIWFVLAAVAVVVAVRFARMRQRRFEVAPGDPVSTLHMDMSKKQSRKTKDALDAASSTLR